MSQQPSGVSGHHKETLRQIFAHPLSHNVEWHDVVSLFHEVAVVYESDEGKLDVTIGGTTHVLTRPRQKELSADELIKVRHLLEELGYRPTSY